MQTMIGTNDIYLDEDIQLMLKAKAGDVEAYGRLYRKYFSAVADFITSINGHVGVQEDIAQDVFLRVWRDREKYEPKSAFKTYLFGYAENIAYEYKASISRTVTLNTKDFVNLTSNLPPPDAPGETEDIMNLLKKLIIELPHKQKLVAELMYLKGYSAREAAQILQCPVYCVYDNLYKAKKNLRKLATVYRVTV